MVEAQVAGLISKGFTMVADGSQRLCALALDLLQKVIEKLIEAAAKACVPVAGWVAAATIVWDAYVLYTRILDIIETVKQIIENVGNLWDSLQSIGSKLSEVKEINDIGDVTALASDIGGDVMDAKKAAGDISDGVTDVKHSATGVKDTAYQPKQPVGAGAGSGSSSGRGRISGSIPPE